MKRKLLVLLFLLTLITIVSAQNTEIRKIAILAGCDGLGDNAFNDSAYKGCTIVAEQLNANLYLQNRKILSGENIEISFIIPQSIDAYSAQIDSLIAEGYSEIVCIGFTYYDAIENAIKKNNYTKFVAIDDEIENANFYPNLCCIKFKDWENTFLAGAVAGLIISDSRKYSKISFIGGMDIPLVQSYEYGFYSGAMYTNHKLCSDEYRITDYVSENASGFNDKDKISEIAIQQIKGNTGVVFPALGEEGMTKLYSILKEAHIYSFGIDGDATMNKINITNNYLPIILTSSIKKIDTVIGCIVSDFNENVFVSGVVEVGVKEDAVDIIIDSNKTPAIYKYRSKINAIKQDIVSGNIVVPSNKKEFDLFVIMQAH
jgi:basic membrane protein A